MILIQIMTAEHKLYLTIGQELKDSLGGQLFGKPCFKVGRKAYICFFQNEMVFKLSGDDHATALNLAGSQLFDPSGKQRPMKEWVQVPGTHSSQWLALAKSAQSYVKGL